MNNNVSTATIRNWNKLNTNIENRLTTRANKCMSKKRFVPVEYFSDKSNVKIIQDAIEVLSKYEVGDIVYSIAVYLLAKKNILNKTHVEKVLSDYSFNFIPQINETKWPDNERDLLGVVYQSLQSEGSKNKKGSYYTPEIVARNMVKDIDFSKGQKFLDPCCGSGAFLLMLDNALPEQIFGIDNDPIAVFISKINLLLKYSESEFIPNIECFDYLEKQNLFNLNSKIYYEQFDYIITNPPWGAVSCENNDIQQITSKESFSCFFVKSFYQLKKHGIIRFLFPESVLNVKTHKDLRNFMLNNCCIDSLTVYDDKFTGVTTKYIDISCSKNEQLQKKAKLYINGQVNEIVTSDFYKTENLVFNFLNNEDMKIVQQVKDMGKYNLSNSTWALGIVTGDNKKKLFSDFKSGFEAIYTGKEIMPYLLKEAKKYILYDRSQLQQVAKEEYYRAEEKLVYKFISNKLTFAYDNKKRLFLNSANILIPNIPGMSIKTVMAFLNSELYQFLYIKMFGEVKILKGNLMEMPFPEISPEQDFIISDIVDDVLSGKNRINDLQQQIYYIFNIKEKEVEHIRRILYGTADKNIKDPNQ
ncbi:MAG: TaqI-like C-terminal specificity domain-containing protein [Acutalibacteraceae bacterium]